jgi:prepilin peptidase CpaA
MDQPVSLFQAWLLSLACVAAITDARSGLIPNWLTLPPLLLAPLAHALDAGPGALGWSLLSAGVCGAVPLALYARGAMGGGDVKLFAAAGALVGVRAALELQLVSYALAAFGASAWLAYRGQLWAVWRRALSLLLGRAQVRTQRPPSELASGVHVRLGVPVFAACVLLALLAMRSPSGPQP